MSSTTMCQYSNLFEYHQFYFCEKLPFWLQSCHTSCRYWPLASHAIWRNMTCNPECCHRFFASLLFSWADKMDVTLFDKASRFTCLACLKGIRDSGLGIRGSLLKVNRNKEIQKERKKARKKERKKERNRERKKENKKGREKERYK